MKRSAPLVLLFAIGALFLILNRAAYKGYFQDDELDNIVMTRGIPAPKWVSFFTTPRFSESNFRPMGHIYFKAMNKLAGLDFPKYVIPVHLLHLLNMVLLWLLLRRLALNPFAACAGAAFFALNVAAFDALWKPMYIFDILCTTFCLATLLLYAHARWALAVLAMWLAYKSKELAVMLPVALFAYEYLFGKRRWKPLIPFCLISLCFGIQAVLTPKPAGHAYQMILTVGAFWETLTFYSSRLFFLPYAGLIFLLIPFAVRDRRVWLGAAMLTAFFTPLLFLPGRMYPAYTYLPLTGAAVELATLASLAPPVAALAFFALWIPWNILELRHDRRATLTADDEVRIYAGALMDFAREHPDAPAISFSSYPATFHMWGVQAALNYPNPDGHVAPKFVDEKAARALPAEARVTFINWDRNRNKVNVLTKDPALPGASYLKMGPEMPIWQLESGWYGLDDYFRWAEPLAKAHLGWPAEANEFEMVVNVSAVMIQKYGYTAIRLRINGKDLGSIRFDQLGIEMQRWKLPPRESSEAHVEFEFEPAGHFPPDPRLLGAPIVAFGFVRAQDGH